ncbi:MAG: phosphoenolpyruvate--protein phosphotransferase [Deltaproteobacteria bacterium]|jgi:phosphocarrier protein FPr|nr:phosphoenolpyruvate--protein phosphotransferase [Deltaproteobacteria bacterium]
MEIEEAGITIFAPISGVIVPITEAPDPTFAEKMVGDGIAIDPTEETLCSPCDGKIIQVHPSGHALNIAAADGTEILLHIGVDTVGLKGKGFKAFVRDGDLVKRHDRLIEFDADYVAQNAPSLMTMVVVTAEGASVRPLASGLSVSGETAILNVTFPSAEDGKTSGGGGQSRESAPIVIMNPDGLHARPSAVLSSNARRFSSVVTIKTGDKEANAKSVVGVMGLSIKLHDKVVIAAVGPDAAEAVDVLTPLVAAGLGENLHVVPGQTKDTVKPAPAPSLRPSESDDPNVMSGVPASPGLVAGKVHQLMDFAVEIEKEGIGQTEERKDLNAAVAKAVAELGQIEKSLRLSSDTSKAAIFAAHKEILEDPELKETALAGIKEGQSAAYAWRESYLAQSKAMAALDNPLLAARAADIRDIGERVLSHLVGFEKRSATVPPQVILLAQDLTPSDAANLNKSGVRGFCLAGGSATSHSSILARAAGLPAVVAAPERILSIPNGSMAILDGDKGFLKVNPSPLELEKVKQMQEEAARIRRQEMDAASQPAMTTDGAIIKICGNISGAPEAAEIPGLGGDGVGLLRSEFLFLDRAEAPSEEEQVETYVDIARNLGPNKELIVRTLDVGGDKPLAYMPLPEEVNPFLGLRGIRLNMLSEEIFTSQVRAILKAASWTRLGVMFPMVSSISEFEAARDIVLSEKEKMGLTTPVQLGVMVEVPSAALMADLLAKEVDFFSIGTNDLTQYTLAIDRGHPKLAKMADALHPAVLKLIKITVEAAHKEGKWVGICGGVAGDVLAAPALIGLGIDELSVSVKGIPTIKAAVRRLSLARCREIAQEAVSFKTAEQVREFLSSVAKEGQP